MHSQYGNAFFLDRIKAEDKTMKKVFVNVQLNEEQKRKLEAVSNNYQFVYDKNDDIFDSEIIVGNYHAADLKNFKNLELLLLTAVGYDAFIKKGILNDKTILCNAVDIHSQEVAEHTLALILELVKKLHLYKNNQSKHLWHDEGQVKSIKGLRVAIIGFGDIGNALAKMLKGLGMYIIGVKRKMIEKPDYIDELHTNADMQQVISDVDVVVTILPGTAENVHLFTMDTFKKMKPDTILVNCGRGNLYEENVLYEALDKKIIAAAAADVFEVEPLLQDSKLYDLDNFVVTPHIAGFFHLESAKDEYVDLICDNLSRYENNEELRYVVPQREN